MRPQVRNDRLFLALLAVVVGLAWVSLWVWGRSPYARFLEHDALANISGEDAALLAFFLAGWTLMVFAMMLPTSLPLIALFHRMVRDRAERLWLVFLLIGGYIAVWAGFGALVHLADLALHQGIYRAPVLDSNDRASGDTGAGRDVPVHAPEAALPRQVPLTLELHRGPLAQHGSLTAGVPAWPQSRPLLPGLLLVADADYVCGGVGQHRVDAGLGGNHGRGEEPALGTAAQQSAGRGPGSRRTADRRERRHLT